MTIIGINYPITIRYRLRGGKWVGYCKRCGKSVKWLPTKDTPIELGWMYWNPNDCMKLEDVE